MFLEDCRGFSVFVRRKVVTDDDGSGLHLWDQDVTDVRNKGFSIHSPFDDPRRDQAVMLQACNKV